MEIVNAVLYEGHTLEITKDKKCELVKKFDRFNVLKHSAVMPNAFTEKGLLQKTGEILADIVGSNQSTANTETEIEFNFAVVKIKHKITRNKELDR